MSENTGRMLVRWVLCAGTILGFSGAPCSAAEQTLGRLCFRVPPERVAAFEAAYEKRVVPILKRHGLVVFPAQEQVEVEGVFSRFFAFDSPADIPKKRASLLEDPSWNGVLKELGTAFGPKGTGNPIGYSLGVYRAPAGPGEVRVAGPGKGRWRTYDVTDGFISGNVRAIFEDWEGNLWFGTSGGGVCKFDGQTFRAFTTRDGLCHDDVQAICQDRDGNLWFGTQGSGLCRYDGRTFTAFTTRDGLPDDRIVNIMRDSEGQLWFVAGSRLCRYDGRSFAVVGKEDGLAADWAYAWQDPAGTVWASSGGVISRYDGQKFVSYAAEDAAKVKAVRVIVQDREGRVWYGTREGVVRFDGQTWTDSGEGWPADVDVRAGMEDVDGHLWFTTAGGGVLRYDGRNWTAFTTDEGLSGNYVRAVGQDREGHLWFGTNGAVSRYDGRNWTAFDTDQGLPHNVIGSIIQDREGNLWIGTNGGLARYDGRTFTTFTEADGLPEDRVTFVFEDRDGNIWAAIVESGVSRYDGRSFRTFTTDDGLAGDQVFTIYQDREGDLWFGTRSSGVSRYDGAGFTTFTTDDGLATDWVWAIVQDRKGNLWFGGEGAGLSRYDGQSFRTFTTDDGLADNRVLSLYEDRDGGLWVGTFRGLNRLDERGFRTFTMADGLAGDRIRRIYQDRDTHLWFCSAAGGLSRYDGNVFQRLTVEDGLTSNAVRWVLHDNQGVFWFSTVNGITRFDPPAPYTPSIVIHSAVADRRYEGVAGLDIPSTVGVVAFEFQGMSMKTRPEGMVYRYRLAGYDSDWRNTRGRRVEYEHLPRGTYTFEVQAVDRDLVYSEAPARVGLTVHLPYERIALGLAIVLVIGQTVRVVLRGRTLKRTQARLIEEMEKELQAARQMQMGLLPGAPPVLEGAELSGICIPARQVGGDYYTFLEEGPDKLKIVLADVSGKGMQAATVAMRLNEMVRYELAGRSSVQEALKGLDRSLRERTPPEMFATCGVGVLDAGQKSLRVVSAGNPEVYHYCAVDREVRPLKVTGMPVGLALILEGIEMFQELEVKLGSGDLVVFASDGVEEAQTAREAFYGEERLAELVRACGEKGMSAEAVRDAIVEDVNRFVGDSPQTDDLTVIVLRVN